MSRSNKLATIRRVGAIHGVNGVAKVGLDDDAQNKKIVGRGIMTPQLLISAWAFADIYVGEYIGDGAERILGATLLPLGRRFADFAVFSGASLSMPRPETIDFDVVVQGGLEMDLEKSTI